MLSTDWPSEYDHFLTRIKSFLKTSFVVLNFVVCMSRAIVVNLVLLDPVDLLDLR